MYQLHFVGGIIDSDHREVSPLFFERNALSSFFLTAFTYFVALNRRILLNVNVYWEKKERAKQANSEEKIHVIEHDRRLWKFQSLSDEAKSISNQGTDLGSSDTSRGYLSSKHPEFGYQYC